MAILIMKWCNYLWVKQLADDISKYIPFIRFTSSGLKISLKFIPGVYLTH